MKAWLIEWPEDDNVPVRWWNPATGWMRDANKATHFCREQDTADYIAAGNWAAVVKPTEHIFIGGADRVDELVSTLTDARNRLRAALEPFAMVAEYDIGTDESDDDLFKPMNKHNRAPRLKVGDFRRSLAAVSRSGDAT